jgi:hypothetical protein
MTGKQFAALLQDLATRLAQEVNELERVLDAQAPALERATWTTRRYAGDEGGPVALCRNDPTAWIEEEHPGEHLCLTGLHDLLEELEARIELLLEPGQEVSMDGR